MGCPMGNLNDALEAYHGREIEFGHFMDWVCEDLTPEDTAAIRASYPNPNSMRPTADDQPTLGVAWEGWAARAIVEPYDTTA